jgi:hypothetical protein
MGSIIYMPSFRFPQEMLKSKTVVKLENFGYGLESGYALKIFLFLSKTLHDFLFKWLLGKCFKFKKQ